MRLCVDDDGLVHDMIAENETWCGWSRVWRGGEWRAVRKKERHVVTCLECAAYAADPVRYGLR